MSEKLIKIDSMIRNRSKRVILATIIFILCGSVPAFGDIYHYKNFLAGSRAALMGGAYVAVSDDSSGAFYNPAGIAFAYGNSLSGSANAFHKVKTKYKKAIKQTHDWERDSSALLPNFFGMVKKFGGFTLAVSYVVPDTSIEHQDQYFTNVTDPGSGNDLNKFHISLHSEDETYYAGPSIAYKFGESFSLGLSIHLINRGYRLLQNQYLEESNGDYTLQYVSQNIAEIGFSPRLGMQMGIGDSMVLGVVAATPSLASSSLIKYTDTFTHDASVPSTGVGAQVVSSSDKRVMPAQLTVGIAYYPSPFLLVAADIDYFSINYQDLQNVMNLSVGAEYFLSSKHSIRAGLFTNNDARPPVTSSTTGNEHIDMSGFTLGYANYSRSSSVTLGLIYSSGKGKSQIFGDSDIRDMERTSITGVFAATYNY